MTEERPLNMLFLGTDNSARAMVVEAIVTLKGQVDRQGYRPQYGAFRDF